MQTHRHKNAGKIKRIWKWKRYSLQYELDKCIINWIMIRTIRNHTLESRKGIIWEFPGSPLSVAQSSIPESTVRELGSCKQQGKKKWKKRKGIICTFPTLLTPKKAVSSQASLTSNTWLCKGGRMQPADRELLLRLLSQSNGRATEAEWAAVRLHSRGCGGGRDAGSPSLHARFL